MLCKRYWSVLYTVHFTAFCLGGRFFRTRCSSQLVRLVGCGLYRKLGSMNTSLISDVRPGQKYGGSVQQSKMPESVPQFGNFIVLYKIRVAKHIGDIRS